MKELTHVLRYGAVTLLVLSVHPCFGAAASIGVSFTGASAGSLAREEEAGVAFQREWNNFSAPGLTNAFLRDTAHQVTAATLTYSSFDVGRSGTLDPAAGLTDANAKLLNAFLYPLNGETGTVTFNGLNASRSYSVVVYTVAENGESSTYWINEASDVGAGALPITSEAASEWKALPEFRRAVNPSDVGNYIQWDTVRPRADGSLSINVTSQSFRAPINAVQLLSADGFAPTTATPKILLQPRNASVHPNESGIFRIVTDGPWDYQWYSNDVVIAGAVSDTFTTVPLIDEFGTRAQYKVVVSSGAGQVTSEAVHLILLPALPPGGIFYDGFNYPVGPLGNWGEWSIDNLAIVTSPGLSYSDGANTLQVTGNALIPPREPAGWINYKYIAVKSFGTTVYGGPNTVSFMSFLYDFRDLTAAGGIGVSGFLGQGDWGNERFFIGKVYGEQVIGFDSGPPRTLSDFTIYTNAFVVLRITQDDANATFDLFINPPLTGLPDQPTLSVVKAGTVEFDGVGVNAGDWNRADPSGPGPIVDEFRFGTTYESVAPIQGASLPALSIQRGDGMVTLSWVPAPEGFILQKNTSLSSAGWTAVGAANPVSIPMDQTTSFFRLIKP